MDKQVDMQAFVGVDFDCEFTSTCGCYWEVSRLLTFRPLVFDKKTGTRDAFRALTNLSWYRQCRPRLNKPQVLDDWSWVPDGLVWRVSVNEYIDSICSSHTESVTCTSSELKRLSVECQVIYAECIGAEPDSTHWANAHGVPVVEVSDG